VQGNRIGVNIDGAATPNGIGIHLDDFSARNLIGGNSPGAGNVIAGNTADGISLRLCECKFNLIQGNWIGTLSDGVTPRPNGGSGVRLVADADNNVIGGTEPGEGNVIAFNRGHGISLETDVLTPVGNAILRNSVFSNEQLGINFDRLPYFNDNLDRDSGPNGGQNFPVLTTVHRNGITSVQGSLHSLPNTTFRLEFFAGTDRDFLGNFVGEGRRFLGALDGPNAVVTGPDGNATFTFSAAEEVPESDFITATASRGFNLGIGRPLFETSRFSRIAGPLIVNSTGDVADSAPGDGACSTVRTDRSGVSEFECTLRAAIQEANALAGPDSISFDIPGGGVPTIRPTSALPAITGPITLDATTQPGSARVQLDGSAAGVAADGLVITGGDSTVRGLIINRFARDGIVLRDGGGNRIERNILGTDATSALALGNGRHGVFITNSDGNLIGGSRSACPFPCNVIAFNGGDGVFVDETSQGNAILANQFLRNAGLPIDLAPDGPNPNDTGDGDSGANDGLNAPIVLAVRPGSTTVDALLTGGVDTEAFPNFRIDFFAVLGGDPEALSESILNLLDETTIVNSETGSGEFSHTIPGDFQPNVLLTATQVRADGSFGSTSEFSQRAEQRLTIRVRGADGIIEEGNAGERLFQIELTAEGPLPPVEQPAIVFVNTRDDSAKAVDGDYEQLFAAAVEFDETKPRTQFVSIKVLGDLEDELDETFFVGFERNTDRFDLVRPDGQSEPPGTVLGTITIRDDDRPCELNLQGFPFSDNGVRDEIRLRFAAGSTSQIEIIYNGLLVRSFDRNACEFFRIIGTNDSEELVFEGSRDASGRVIVPTPRNLTFDAGGQSDGRGDAIQFENIGQIAAMETEYFGDPDENGDNGFLRLFSLEDFGQLPLLATVGFFGLDPLEVLDGQIGEVVLHLPDGADDAVLGPIGDPAAGLLQIGERPGTPRTFEITSFPTPTTEIVVNGGDGDDRLEVTPLAVPITFDGGTGTNQLRVQTLGAPTTIVGNTVQVAGFAPITFTNFALVDTIDTPPAAAVQITDLRLITNRRQRVTAVLIQFDGELDRATAEDVNHYTIALPDRRGNFGTRRNRTARLRGASYDSDAHTVRLDLQRPLPPNRRFRLTVQDAVLDAQGIALDGDADGQPGGNHLADGGVWHDHVRYTDRDGDIVIMSLARNGALADLDQIADLVDASLMEFVWDADGEARSLRLVGPNLASHVLRGRVIPTGGDGRTTIGQIADLDGVANRLPQCGAAQDTRCFDVNRIAATLVDQVLGL
jgi:CSLREA domain-containing protein